MKKIYFLLFMLTVCVASAQKPDPNFTDKIAFQDALSFLKSARFIEAEGNADTDLTYQRLNFAVDPAVNQISGSVFSQVKFKKDNVSILRFDLNSVLTVDSVRFNQKKIAFGHNANKISITLPAPMAKNSTATTEIFYHGTPPQSGFGAFFTGRHNNTPILWTLSEPYGAMDWWPCKESLSDKIDSLDVFVTSPSQYKAASNGKLISDVVSGSKRTAHWKHRYPIATYLVAIAVTNYETYSDFVEAPDGKKIEILNYMYPEYLATAKTKSGETRDIMDLYNRKFITYPFAAEKYGHAQFGWGGGMEHQTMSFMTNLDFELVAHEMAHQWFGDYITLASWHDIWLNEGFATYLSGIAYENLLNGVWWPDFKKRLITSVTSSPGGSVYVADTTDVSRIFSGRLSYNKGASLLHMLRWEIGDELFFKGLKNYLTDPKIANGFASQAQFVTHMETVADTSLTEFFKDWYYGEGYPKYQLTYFPDPANPSKQKLRVNQVPSHSSVSFFEMHLPIRLWKSGRATDIRIHHTQQNQEFSISDQPFDRLEFDPNGWLIAKVDQITAAKPEMTVPEIRIIPDIAQGKIRIILPELEGNETVQLFDITGKMVMTQKLKSTDSLMDTGGLKSGLYLVKVQSGQTQKNEKMVIN
ncbi:MAG: T9SS type A sorting domain-containing protein [Prolixibacteraceae bacterium]|nr:T9SS type A sorting domain-containing protein [Prolixibacteraceae bacterium]